MRRQNLHIISIMETNHHLHNKCHWESFVCFVFSQMFCLLKTHLPLVFRKNFIKSVQMKLRYLMIVCGKRKHTSLFPLWIPITTSITSVIWDHLCVLCSRSYPVVKKPFCLSFLGQTSSNQC